MKDLGLAKSVRWGERLNRGFGWVRARLPVAILAGLYVPVLVILLATVLASSLSGAHFADFTRDPAAVAGTHPFVGVVSNVGILLWCASATLCFLCFVKMRRESGGESVSKFFLFSGLITAILLFDDMLQFHEYVLPRYLHVPWQVTFFGYGLMTVLYLASFRAVILKTDFTVLMTAYMFFGISVLADAIHPHVRIPAVLILEDTCKVLGIATWLGYFAILCSHHVHASLPAELTDSAVIRDEAAKQIAQVAS